jgi:recombination protein RecT
MAIHPNIVALRLDLEKQQRELAMVLPKHIDVAGFCRIVLTAVSINDKLILADRTTLLAACMEAAEDGLLPDGREGAIVPYHVGKKEAYVASWQPMVWGLVKLVRQSGELLDLGAHVVRRSDRFDYLVNEHGEHFRHQPDFEAPDAPPMLVYAYGRTKDGGVYFEAMPWHEVEKFRERAKAKSDDSPWQTWPDEMAKVRVLKRLCKRLPMSTAARIVLVRDDARDSRLLGLAPEGSSGDPIAALNLAIGRGDVPPAEPRAPAASADAMMQSGAAVVVDEPPEPAQRSRPPRARQRRVEVIAMSYAEVADAMQQAADLPALYEAAALIERVSDEQQRKELDKLCANLEAEFHAPEP